MAKLSLKVGSTYLTRHGHRSLITSKIDESTHAYSVGYRFVGGPCGQYYTEDGLTYAGDPDPNPGDLIGDLGDTGVAFLERLHRLAPNGGYGKLGQPPNLIIRELDDNLCRLLLAAECGYDISQLDVDQNCSVLAKHAIVIIKAAFEGGRHAGLEEAKEVKS